MPVHNVFVDTTSNRCCRNDVALREIDTESTRLSSGKKHRIIDGEKTLNRCRIDNL